MSGWMRRFISRVTVASLALAPSLTRADVIVEIKSSVQVGPLPTARWERGKSSRAYVCADNQDTATIASASWDVSIDQAGIAPNGVYGRPAPSLDFFSNFNMNDAPGYMAFGQFSGVNTLEGGAAPGTAKALEFFDFYIATSAPLGLFSFNFDYANFGDTQAGTVNPALNPSPQQFRIMPKKGDVNGDEVLDSHDVVVFAQALLGNPASQSGENYPGEYCDWSGNDDGQLDGGDVQGFISNYLTNGA